MSRETDTRECRQQVLERAIALGQEVTWTTREMASALACHEPSVRAAVGWLIAGGLITVEGRECRRTRGGDRYYAMCYRWLGRTRQVSRVPQSRDARRNGMMMNSVTATQWLSRAW
ncbi:MAG: hypothetical protein EOM21_19760 [Gammaproteobacteria bacterium]|nr:hypothetical protein [Gammaproteobacteria bacterium]